MDTPVHRMVQRELTQCLGWCRWCWWVERHKQLWSVSWQMLQAVEPIAHCHSCRGCRTTACT
jgi:hypothetical protein